MSKLTEKEVEELQAEIKRLHSALDSEKEKRTEAEKAAESVSNAGKFFGNTEEQPTGKTVDVETCLNPWERDTKKQKFKTVKMPTFFYTIQIPTGAGLSVSTNGVEYYHGETYEVDYNTLVDLKSRVARCWDHEKSIHSDNENAYRKPTNLHFKAAGVRH